MSQIRLRLRSELSAKVDAASIRLDEWASKSAKEIERVSLPSSTGSVTVGDCFSVSVQSGSEMPRLVLEGCLKSVTGIGFQHKVGEIVCESNVGDYAGSCLLGGRMIVRGDAGDHLGGPMGSRGVGMNGGQLIVEGSAGDDAGHRMRRGEIWIGGDVGDRLAGWMVAGTIGVKGDAGEQIAYGMRRGTLIFGSRVALDERLFSKPIPLRSAYLGLLERGAATNWLHADLLDRLEVCRGDRNIDGRGEVWMPRG
ncbi:formylmethanofuran dehydrogenase subunit C [Rhodopirellula sp. JC740]|uniref:Formylmethanofuran dehydrogenase subunit C n=1 Tax=Rhodopirellula halodulae TaxID=2894198 RepID=A0ABS8NDS2_9BACT|nr:formylmethanofuran dehydrogenase subunit C [Rhodopirellula sp. JC740]MCC9641701.1 formylmethanofuran dehydrogenase subunit C [Rhodopirellula sp. JC740]